MFPRSNLSLFALSHVVISTTSKQMSIFSDHSPKKKGKKIKAEALNALFVKARSP